MTSGRRLRRWLLAASAALTLGALGAGPGCQTESALPGGPCSARQVVQCVLGHPTQYQRYRTLTGAEQSGGCSKVEGATCVPDGPPVECLGGVCLQDSEPSPDPARCGAPLVDGGRADGPRDAAVRDSDGPRDGARERRDASAHDQPGDWPPPAPPPTVAAPLRLDLAGGRGPRAFFVDGALLVFYGDTGGAKDLLLRRRPDAGSFGAPIKVFSQALARDLVPLPSGELLLAGATATAVAVLRGDAAGAVWTFEKGYTSADSFLCSGWVESRFFRPLTADRKLAVGFQHDTHVFGCTQQSDLATWSVGGGWATPTSPGLQDFPGGAYVVGQRLVFGSGFGVFTSDDGGKTFVKQPDLGGGTIGLLRTDRLAASGAGLVGVQAISWASQHRLRLLATADGVTWTVRDLHQAAYVFDPRIAADGADLVACWRELTGWFFKYSHDGGASWSAPVSLGVAAVVEVAVHGPHAAIVREVATSQVELVEATW